MLAMILIGCGVIVITVTVCCLACHDDDQGR